MSNRRRDISGLKNLIKQDIEKGNLEKKPAEETSNAEQKNPIPAIQAAIGSTGLTKKARSLISVNVDLCRPWRFADRHNSQINEEVCHKLIDDIRKNGQEVPAIARRLDKPEDGKEFEIISGRRRLFACSKTKEKNILLDVRNINDREAAKVMVKENENRESISDFERAISMNSQLNEGLWATQEDMRREYEDLDNRSYSYTSFQRLLTAGRLYDVKQVINLIPEISQVNVTPASNLVKLLENETKKKEVILKRASKIKSKISAGEKFTASKILSDLIGCVERSKESNSSLNYIKVGSNERAIEVKSTEKQTVFKLNNKSVDKETIEKIKQAIERIV